MLQKKPFGQTAGVIAVPVGSRASPAAEVAASGQSAPGSQAWQRGILEAAMSAARLAAEL